MQYDTIFHHPIWFFVQFFFFFLFLFFIYLFIQVMGTICGPGFLPLKWEPKVNNYLTLIWCNFWFVVVVLFCFVWLNYIINSSCGLFTFYGAIEIYYTGKCLIFGCWYYNSYVRSYYVIYFVLCFIFFLYVYFAGQKSSKIITIL